MRKMQTVELLEKMKEPIIKWYQENKRELPWRKEKNPYFIWISEIMLQQTRIEAVMQYYQRFLENLPTLSDLAQVEEEKLLKLWEGLGYYNRARNLKKAAQIVQEKYGGQMPKTYEELVKLPGIGEYTAGAIASIAYNEPVPAVDGNVLRVVSRVTRSLKDVLEPKTKKEFTLKLQQIMPKQAGDFNEGLMELGERICLPNGTPNCSQCPVREICLAYQENLTEVLPVRNSKTKRKKEQKTVFLLEWENKIAIRKREEKGLLANLYEFPNVAGNLTKAEIETILKTWNLEAKQIKKQGNCRHIFSHVEWEMVGYRVLVGQNNVAFLWVEKQELLEKYAIPGAFAKFRESLF